MITATNPFTGEIIELADTTSEDIEKAYDFIKTFEKTLKELNEQLKHTIAKRAVDDLYQTPNGRFKSLVIQRQTYDKGLIRPLVDEDVFDTFTVIKKSLVDSYLAEQVFKQTITDEEAKAFKAALIPDGKPYEQIKFERTAS